MLRRRFVACRTVAARIVIAAGKLAVAVVFAAASSLPATAQSRADEIAKQQEKEQGAEPYRANRLEVFLSQVEQGKWDRMAPSLRQPKHRAGPRGGWRKQR